MPKKLLTTNWQKHIIIFAFENRKYIVSPNIKIIVRVRSYISEMLMETGEGFPYNAVAV